MFSKFSEETQKVLVQSKKEMKELKHSYVGSEHLFLALLKLDKTFSNKLKKFGITYSKFRQKLIDIVGVGVEENDWFIYTPLLKRILETAILVSKESSLNEVTNDHLIYAILEEGEGVALRILDKFEIDLTDLQTVYTNNLTIKKRNNKKKMMIDEFGFDLTKKALKRELDPVVGRDKETERVIEILCRRSKNNPLLIGEAGVGKTAIVEELARMISNDEVPDKLKNKRIVSVSVASLVSGTKYRGEFEERITKMLKELEDNDNIILFIDEIHTIMGAGGAEGAIDAANIFKPALARGKIKLIGATTLDEYKRTIEKDRAMERRFQTIFVEEPSNNQVYDILLAIKPLYEKYHNVKISNDLLKEIINLSNKYIYDRKQPDKSVDILDEVCSRVSLQDSNKKSKLKIYKEELKVVRDSKNKYLINEDFASAVKVKDREKELVSKINNIELRNSSKNCRQIKLGDIALIISEKSGIPIYEINGINNKYIDNLEKELSKNIIGQNDAIKELINITKRIKLGYKDDNKPVSILFVGPTGVGKTKLATIYSDYLFGKNKLIRIDGSEYKDSASLSKFLGSSPGYIGYDDNKNKLEEIRNNPHSLILFDEIEKAHPSFLNLFLQILDDGKITDNKGNTIYFNNNIIIMTSNIGFTKSNIGFTDYINKEDSKLKDFLSVELLNRIKKTIYFNKMNYSNIYLIIKMKICSVKEKFKNRGINIHIGNKVIDKIVNETRYLEFGARKVDCVIEEIIDNYVIDEILKDKKDIYVNC